MLCSLFWSFLCGYLYFIFLNYASVVEINQPMKMEMKCLRLHLLKRFGTAESMNFINRIFRAKKLFFHNEVFEL